MIRVRVHINETQIIDIHVVRQDEFEGSSAVHQYSCYITDAWKEKHVFIGILKHKYSDGGAQLSVKLLQLYETCK